MVSSKIKKNKINLNAEKLFNLLANSTRLRCLSLLQQEGELCVCLLTHVLKTSQPKISRHLALLRQHQLLTYRRAGIWIYYQLNSALPTWIHAIIDLTVQANCGNKPYKLDSQRLATVGNRQAWCRTRYLPKDNSIVTLDNA